MKKVLDKSKKRNEDGYWEKNLNETFRTISFENK